MRRKADGSATFVCRDSRDAVVADVVKRSELRTLDALFAQVVGDDGPVVGRTRSTVVYLNRRQRDHIKRLAGTVRHMLIHHDVDPGAGGCVNARCR